MSDRHIIRDVESSLPVNVTLPAYRSARATDAREAPLARFKRGLYGSARRYAPPSNVRTNHHA